MIRVLIALSDTLVRLSAILVYLGLALIGCTQSNPSVKITNLEGNSGGSGAVLWSLPSRSLVLTNAHVCAIAEHGALIHSDALPTPVLAISYRVYAKHDLCALTVFADLNAHLDIAPTRPTTGDKVFVVGYPHLLPRKRLEGTIDGAMMASIAVGTRECTQEDLTDPQKMPYCVISGRLPIIRNYEVQSLSVLISPGNSGSPVLNEAGQLVGVVFAEQGNPGWAFEVPYQYVSDFLNELKTPGKEQFPDMTINF